MIKLFDRLFHKKQLVVPKVDKSVYGALPHPKYDFVEQYTVVDPKYVLNGGYGLWSLCKTVPVVCEEGDKSTCDFYQSIRMPSKVVLGFLNDLKKAPAEKIADPKMRTLSIVHLDDKHRIYILPNLLVPRYPTLFIENDNDDDESIKGWSLYMTPEKNRAVVEQLKIHTR